MAEPTVGDEAPACASLARLTRVTPSVRPAPGLEVITAAHTSSPALGAFLRPPVMA